MTEAMPDTDSKYVPYPVHAVPANRTNLLSLLRHYDDNVEALSPAQLAAFRKLFFLDDTRTVQRLVEDGVL
jgi:hypothetical protein